MVEPARRGWRTPLGKEEGENKTVGDGPSRWVVRVGGVSVRGVE